MILDIVAAIVYTCWIFTEHTWVLASVGICGERITRTNFGATGVAVVSLATGFDKVFVGGGSSSGRLPEHPMRRSSLHLFE
eukprot:CAMPEP_0174706622 /NCGR_PEP_ID=MMETSP1094-20130205/9402_1 /TAXON_ID=156173 /ORGANISM="Chrysochromulina brevifilum, Strain UTEX LB 985" /LENGTH=80 /DNA_ID=CAMNT_0015904907 /DNA_START=305 /DNA_END=544 /DNA_ORIENTATION=+